VARIKKEHKEFQSQIESAFSGDADELAAIIQGAGWIHTDNGIRQKDIDENIISKRTLLDWRKDGLETINIGRSKFYPIMPFLKFVIDRSIKSHNMENDEVKKWTLTEAEFKARKRQLDFEVEQGLYVEVEDIKKVWCQHIAACRKRLLAIPRAMASRLQGETKRAVIEKEIKSEVYSALEELAGQ